MARVPFRLFLAAVVVVAVGAGCDPERQTGQVPEDADQPEETVTVGDIATTPQDERTADEDDG